MTRLSIRHETLYLLVRPRDSHADRLVEASLRPEKGPPRGPDVEGRGSAP